MQPYTIVWQNNLEVPTAAAGHGCHSVTIYIDSQQKTLFDMREQLLLLEERRVNLSNRYPWPCVRSAHEFLSAFVLSMCRTCNMFIDAHFSKHS